jgi:O-antigen biosynthesis protein
MIGRIKAFILKMKATFYCLNPFRFPKYFSQVFDQACGGSSYHKEYIAKKSYFLPGERQPIRLVAFYLPQFHPIPENNRWWGDGFTEWTNVSKAIPQFMGHYQPHLPGELGFYDLRVEDVLRKQVDLARNYGLAAFCFYHYWFNGKTLLELPIEQFFNNKNIDFEFCLCWANENWTRRWDGQEDDILISQKHSPEDDIALIHHLKKYLMDDRYLRISGKPVILVYRPNLLPDPVQTASRWREWCRLNGVGEIYLVYAQSFENNNPIEYGFDAATEFPPGQAKMPNITRQLDIVNPEFSGKVFDYKNLAKCFMDRCEDKYPLFKAVCPGWDNEARRPGKGRVFHGSSPGVYAEWLQKACDLTMTKDPDERLLFVNAWNEWAEGAHLEPDRKYGYAYLQATADVLHRLK